MFNIPRKEHDRAVHFVPSQDPTDLRILTAEELALASEISALSLKKEGALRFIDTPKVSILGHTLGVEGVLESAIYAKQSLLVNFNLEVEKQESKGGRDEYFYLMTMLAYVGAELDSELGSFSLQYSGSTAVNKTENTRRLRCFWLTVSSQYPLAPDGSDIFSATRSDSPSPQSHSPIGRLDINTTQTKGFTVGGLRFYKSDPNLVNGTYDFLLDSIELCPICRIKHYYDVVVTGFNWDDRADRIPTEELSLIAYQKTEPSAYWLLYRLMQGEPLPGGSRSRAVLNTILGASNINSTYHPGMTSASPNGSNIQGNDQRTFYANEARLQRNSLEHLTVVGSEDGTPMIVATLNTENPDGSYFSRDKNDHRIYSEDGVLQNDFGSFSDLGSDRSLSWFANRTSSVQIGDRVLVAPGIVFAAGSGFSLPITRVDYVYHNGQRLEPANVLNARGDDLDSYREPDGGDRFFVVWGSERAALHYIYKKITITTDSNGVATVPPTELGCFAFIEGVSGRINEPIYLGLKAEQQYNCLVYYPPRSNGEIWQFEVTYTPYQGMGEPGSLLLDGAKIVSQPICIVHSQGGGLSVHRNDSSLGDSPIAFHLPSTPAQFPSYRLNNPVRLQGEVYPGPITLRETPLLHGRELSVPAVGQVLKIQKLGTHYPKSLNVKVETSDGKLLGYRNPSLHNQVAHYQSVCAFLVENFGHKLLVVVTHNESSGEDLPFTAGGGAAIDVFDCGVAYQFLSTFFTAT